MRPQMDSQNQRAQPGKGSREAIVDAAERLFLERGFGAVSMDELAAAAGLSRRTLYNQFASKDEIFRDMLSRVSRQIEDEFPSGIETTGDAEHVLCTIALNILDLHKSTECLGLLRILIADARQFPWLVSEFASTMHSLDERLTKYLVHLTHLAVLNCQNPQLAAHQLFGLLSGLSLWFWMMGRECLPIPEQEAVRDTVRMFLQHYQPVDVGKR